MYTAKENLMRTLEGRNPDRFVEGWNPFAIILNDPVYLYLRSNRVRGQRSLDRWGTCIYWPQDQPAAVPHITEENKVLKDITKWEELIVPDLAGNCTDWTAAKQTIEEIDRNEKLIVGFMPTGLFEQSHFLMGMEDALCNLILEPEAMHALLEVIGAYRMTYAKLLVENMKPDVILSHDDWGEKSRLFMHPDTWREFFKPHYAELYAYMKQNGVIVMHHADSYCEPIAEDMAEIGVDIWQGVLPQNDIPGMQKQLAGRMTLMGGIDTPLIDTADWSEETIRAETRRTCFAYGEGGCFIPCHTYGLPWTIYPEVDSIIRDEISRCSGTIFPV